MYGIAYLGHQIGAMLSSWLGGRGFEHFGTHWIAFGSSGALLFIASAVSLRLPLKGFTLMGHSAPRGYEPSCFDVDRQDHPLRRACLLLACSAACGRRQLKIAWQGLSVSRTLASLRRPFVIFRRCGMYNRQGHGRIEITGHAARGTRHVMRAHDGPTLERRQVLLQEAPNLQSNQKIVTTALAWSTYSIA